MKFLSGEEKGSPWLFEITFKENQEEDERTVMEAAIAVIRRNLVGGDSLLPMGYAWFLFLPQGRRGRIHG
jgi:hypothetical protein